MFFSIACFFVFFVQLIWENNFTRRDLNKKERKSIFISLKQNYINGLQNLIKEWNNFGGVKHGEVYSENNAASAIFEKINSKIMVRALNLKKKKNDIRRGQH